MRTSTPARPAAATAAAAAPLTAVASSRVTASPAGAASFSPPAHAAASRPATATAVAIPVTPGTACFSDADLLEMVRRVLADASGAPMELCEIGQVLRRRHIANGNAPVKIRSAKHGSMTAFIEAHPQHFQRHENSKSPEFPFYSWKGPNNKPSKSAAATAATAAASPALARSLAASFAPMNVTPSGSLAAASLASVSASSSQVKNKHPRTPIQSANVKAKAAASSSSVSAAVATPGAAGFSSPVPSSAHSTASTPATPLAAPFSDAALLAMVRSALAETESPALLSAVGLIIRQRHGAVFASKNSAATVRTASYGTLKAFVDAHPDRFQWHENSNTPSLPLISWKKSSNKMSEPIVASAAAAASAPATSDSATPSFESHPPADIGMDITTPAYSNWSTATRQSTRSALGASLMHSAHAPLCCSFLSVFVPSL